MDSKQPRLYKTSPAKGDFADGTFEVSFSEDNPEELTLFYGNSSKELNIATECSLERKKYFCSTEVDLSVYNGQEIEYYFKLKDVSGNSAETKKIKVKVDTSEPILNNPSSFWTQGTGRENKYIYFNMNINEANFEKVSYSYIKNGRVSERTLCSRLENGMCEKKKSFAKGHYELTISIIDEAGNAVGYPVVFDVV